MHISPEWINTVATISGMLVALGIVVQQLRTLGKAIDHLTLTVEHMRTDAAKSNERMARLEEKVNHHRGD